MTRKRTFHFPDFEIVAVEANLVPACYEMALNTEWVPKLAWTAPLPDMLLGGLVSGRWSALVLLDSTGALASYVDYRARPNGIDVGICMTGAEFRGRGLMSALLSAFVADNPACDITIGTCERNVAMRRVIEKCAFVPTERKEDRVDGETTIYYRRHAHDPEVRRSDAFGGPYAPAAARSTSQTMRSAVTRAAGQDRSPARTRANASRLPSPSTVKITSRPRAIPE